MAFAFNAKETAIAILHVQNDLTDVNGKFAQAGIAAQVKKYNVLENIAKAAEASRKAGAMVIYMNAHERPEYPAGESKTFNFPLFKGFWQSGGMSGGWGSENPREVQPRPTDVIIKNPFSDCFNSSDLDMVLRANDKFNLVLVGLATNFAIESTARRGAELGYNISIIEVCIQSMTDKMHDFGVNVMLPFFGQVISLDEYVAALKS